MMASVFMNYPVTYASLYGRFLLLQARVLRVPGEAPLRARGRLGMLHWLLVP